MKKEDKIKWATNIFKFLFIIFLIIYITLYVSQKTGYYEFEQHQKVALTEEKIKQFEEDVSKGKDIDLEDYIDKTDKSYQNKTSQLGLTISQGIGNSVKAGVEGLFKFLNRMIEE